MNLASPDTLIALPGGGQVSAGFLAGQGIYQTDPASGQIIVPEDAYAVGFGGTTYQIGQHTDWFPGYTAPPKKDDTSATDTANADAQIKAVLDSYGLGSLAPWAY